MLIYFEGRFNMENNLKALWKRSFTFFAIIIFSALLTNLASLINFNGILKTSAAGNLSSASTKEVIQKKIGYISRVYEKNGKRFLTFDEVKFLTGAEAVEAAKKDGNAIFENGKYSVLDDYYIVNENKGLINYSIDNNASLSLLGFMVSDNGNDITNKVADYESFKSSINNKNYPKLCYIYLQGNAVTKVESQYVP
jgi:hypothetical protein